MSHPDPTKTYDEWCAFCKQPAIDSLEFEAGNNAELPVSVPVCEAHWNECEKDEWAFRDKYAAKIDGMAYERLIDHADSLRNAHPSEE